MTEEQIKYREEIFNLIDAYVSKYIEDIIPKLFMEESEYRKLVDTTNLELEKLNNRPIFIDNDEHMWYNKFNKWSWAKFENGVVKINDEYVNQ